MVRFYRFIKARELIMKIIFTIAALVSVLALITIISFLVMDGVPFMFEYGLLDFLTGTEWSASSGEFGILPMIITSIYATGLSVLVGGTIGLFSAICLYKFFPKKIVGVLMQVINVLAGIPSVIIGLFGLKFIVPFLRDYVSPDRFGYGLLAATIVLSLMILPTIISVTMDSLESVPKQYYEAALALGATKEQATFKIMLPAATSGVMTAIVLAMGRAIGETMAVMMVMGGQDNIPTSLFQSVISLTYVIASGAGEVTGTVLSAKVATGLVLFAFTLCLTIFAAMIKGRMMSEGKDKKSKKLEEKAKQDKEIADKISADNFSGDMQTPKVDMQKNSGGES